MALLRTESPDLELPFITKLNDSRDLQQKRPFLRSQQRRRFFLFFFVRKGLRGRKWEYSFFFSPRTEVSTFRAKTFIFVDKIITKKSDVFESAMFLTPFRRTRFGDSFGREVGGGEEGFCILTLWIFRKTDSSHIDLTPRSPYFHVRNVCAMIFRITSIISMNNNWQMCGWNTYNAFSDFELETFHWFIGWHCFFSDCLCLIGKPKEVKVLMIGAPKAGGTTILYKLKLGEVLDPVPGHLKKLRVVHEWSEIWGFFHVL